MRQQQLLLLQAWSARSVLDVRSEISGRSHIHIIIISPTLASLKSIKLRKTINKQHIQVPNNTETSM
jgi:hypothetical protein